MVSSTTAVSEAVVASADEVAEEEVALVVAVEDVVSEVVVSSVESDPQPTSSAELMRRANETRVSWDIFRSVLSGR